MKKWTILGAEPEKVNMINRLSDLGPLLSEIVAARGMDTREKLEAFFNADSLGDPFLLSGMNAAVESINSAIDSGSKIAIYGDYDCDGICSTAILYDYLLSMGADVTAFIPEREDGYGLSEEAVKKIKDSGAELIITVDNGISALEESKLIYKLGMKLVITDHHQPPAVLPTAEAVIDPHLMGDVSEFKDLCGAGVALKLCAALDGGDYEAVCEQYLDLCAVATVADVMPLTGENRVIVSRGLRLLENTENPGLRALLDGLDKKPVTSSFIAFNIAPRINAASRFGTASTALELLLCEDGETAKGAAEKIDGLNSGRREREAKIIADLTEKLDKSPDKLLGRVLTVSEKDLPHGLIGIIAARLTDTYDKPAIVLSIDENGLATGSARSVKGFNIFRCFESCADLFVKFGGHELAGGLTIEAEKIPELEKRIEDYARKTCPSMPAPEIVADKILRGSEITYENARSLSRLEPFGTGNPEPVFKLDGAVITRLTPLSGGEHTKLGIDYDGIKTELLMFRTKTSDLEFRVGDKIDAMARMRPREYAGSKSAELISIAVQPHGIIREKFLSAIDVYSKFMRNEDVDKRLLSFGIPSREELVAAYKAVDRSCGSSIEGLYSRLGGKINSFRLMIIISAFCDAGLLEIRPSDGKIRVIPPTKKADIELSETLIRIKREAQGAQEA